MPKKTRREKVLAKERRLKLLRDSYAPVSHVAIAEPHRAEKKIIKKEAEPDDSPSQKSTDATRTYFIHDFRKSLLYIGIIIALEIAVYFGTINNYLKF